MTRRTEIRNVPYQHRQVEWQWDECLNCHQEISRCRDVKQSGLYQPDFGKWKHRNGRTECTFYAEPLDRTADES